MVIPFSVQRLTLGDMDVSGVKCEREGGELTIEVCVLKGCTSIWFTTGLILGFESSSSLSYGSSAKHTTKKKKHETKQKNTNHQHTCLTPKLLTPALLILPCSTASMIARQHSSRLATPPYGLCSRYRSTYPSAHSRSESVMAVAVAS